MTTRVIERRILHRSVRPLVAAALLFLGAPASAQLSGQLPQQILNQIKINEVNFNPLGTDAGNEWIELYNKGANAISLNGTKLYKADASVLASLPNVTLPVGSYYVVYLGPQVDSMVDNDFTDSDATWFTQQVAANRLNNTSDGIYLGKNGFIYDAVFWGTGAPPTGAGYNDAIQQNRWQDNDYVNLSIASGHACFEGSTLGRDTFSTDTDTGADFALDGGKNSALATPGDRNDLLALTIDQAIHWSQAIVNDEFAVLRVPHTNIEVTYATHDNVQTGDPDLFGGYQVQAHNTFNISYNGTAYSMTGDLLFSYDRSLAPSGETAFTASVSGLLATANNDMRLDFSYVLTLSGFHTLARISHSINSLTWTESGHAYPYSCNTTITTTQTGESIWTINDSRTGADWGGLTKTAIATEALTKTGDGAYHEQATLTQTAPPPPPPLGQTQSVTGNVVTNYQADFVIGADFSLNKTFPVYEYLYQTSDGTTISKIEITEPATATVTRTQGQFLDPLGEFTYSFHRKLRVGNPPDPSDPGEPVDVSETLSRQINAAGEFVEFGAITGGLAAANFYIDARLGDCGCGCGGSGCSCGSPKSETDWGSILSLSITEGGIAALCAAGTANTSPAALTGGGIVIPATIAGLCTAGATFVWLTWDIWH